MGAGDAPAPTPAGRAGPAVALSGLGKRYGGVTALEGVSFAVERGSIHAVVGENGAGKSTLMKILAGAVRPDAGTIVLDGEEIGAQTPDKAHERGIGIVYQELSLFPARSVLANLFANAELTRGGLISRRRMIDRARPLLDEIGLSIPLETPVGELPIGEQQLVELARVLLAEPSLLILDEPNSALSEGETRRLFAVLRRLAASGITILYVSHRLEEVFEIADRVTVLRNARHVLTADRRALSVEDVVRAMLGEDPSELYPTRATAAVTSGRNLEAADVTVRGRLDRVSFSARPGEILGLSGIEGAGVAELLSVLFGARRAHGGTVTFPDAKGLPRSPNRSAQRAISLVPSDRRRQGLMLEQSVAANIAHVTAGALGRHAWLGRRQLAAGAERELRSLQIKADSVWSRVHHLSGGNQQKVVIGKWLEISPNVVLLDDPARGVDVGAKREIFTIIRRLADEGCIVIFRSTEIPEVIGLADRILAFYRGRIVADQPAADFDSTSLLHAINTGQVVAKG